MNLQTFNFHTHGVRVVMLDGQPWFVGKDVAEVLGYANPQKAIRDHVDEEDRGGERIVTPSGEQEVTIINESGLYSLILKSKLPSAKAFKRWVTAEVLPSIRQTGGYQLAPQPAALPSYSEALRQLADTLDAKAQVEERLALAAPKVEAYDALMESEGLMLMREAGKVLGIGQNRLYALLRDLGVIIPKSCEPYQCHVDAGRFVLRTVTYMRGDTQASSQTTYVTTKGLEYIRQRLQKAGAA